MSADDADLVARAGDTVHAPNASPVLPRSLLERLPTELLSEILSYVLPQHQKLSFVKLPRRYFHKSRWVVMAQPLCTVDNRGTSGKEKGFCWDTYCSLIRTCSTVSVEAQAMLYKGNQFSVSTRSPLTRGGDVGPLSPIDLRRVTSLHVLLDFRLRPVGASIECHQRFMRRFVDAISGRDGNDDKAMLRRVEVKVQVSSIYSDALDMGDITVFQSFTRGMRILEVLRELPRVECVEFAGLPTWFATCLALCIRGEGGQVQLLDWPTLRWENRLGMVNFTSTRPEDVPLLDWGEFAHRNNIELPNAMASFFQKCRERLNQA
ncbi:hypothetical protein E8E13_008043 [Curvularia kusanoi]|uniref:F-box domain-containing protein n=1 Tax=Curvularia kusanoi TaxID=90978 RepID=A0A9P4TCB2_CURKU|nr:hypothetical protein E8E13_008043 [Curvularia kusanoi]